MKLEKGVVAKFNWWTSLGWACLLIGQKMNFPEVEYNLSIQFWDQEGIFYPMVEKKSGVAKNNWWLGLPRVCLPCLCQYTAEILGQLALWTVFCGFATKIKGFVRHLCFIQQIHELLYRLMQKTRIFHRFWHNFSSLQYASIC